jgi:hypothetical protein
VALLTKTPVFISFDYDHDAALKEFLVGQAKNDDSPFFIKDWSIKKETKRWKADAKKRIQWSKVVIVICGRHTSKAAGVAAEIQIARGSWGAVCPLAGLQGRQGGASCWHLVVL